MEFDEFENYIAVLKEQRKTPREREIEKKLADIAIKYKAAIEAECAPLLKELTQIEFSKGPLPILHEGQLYAFHQPQNDQ